MGLLMVGQQPLLATMILGTLRRRSAIRLEVGEAVARHLHQALVVHIAGSRDHHVVAHIVALHVFADHVRAEVADGVDRTQNGAPDRLARICSLLEQVEDVVVGIVAGSANLLHDHLLFPRQFVVFEQRVLQDVRQDIGGQHHIILEHAGEIAGVLDGGCSVEIAAHIFDRLGDLERCAAGGALERHVLEQVRYAMLAFALAAGACLDPHPDRGAFEVRHVVGKDHHAVVEGR